MVAYDKACPVLLSFIYVLLVLIHKTSLVLVAVRGDILLKVIGLNYKGDKISSMN